ncbi:hypothetical protein QYE76_040964 [Lolium multiflorum]|uniref:Uncharacterized protein n=1 Tax=Lolium multiflorum TaxID=4521 RepID=A0AAD8WVH6_LOLMU|nr:hypothetical protein QYE76_040964 [Lolium multiflorum]
MLSPPTPQSRRATDVVPTFRRCGSDLGPGSTSTPPGMPFHQVRFPPSTSPLPAWISIRHVSAAVRLQAAARSLLVRRRVWEMRDLQLQLLQVALHCATDLDLVRCVGDLGRAVSPTGGGHAIFPAGSDLKVCAIDSHSAGRRHGVTDRSAPRSTSAFRRRPPRGLLLFRWFPCDPVKVEDAGMVVAIKALELEELVKWPQLAVALRLSALEAVAQASVKEDEREAALEAARAHDEGSSAVS